MTTSRAFCIVDGCQNKNPNKELSFFKLPKEKERRKKWLQVINRPDLMERPNLKPESHVVCSVHFEKHMIIHTPRLNPDAIPTKNLPKMSATSDSTPETSKPDSETSMIEASTQTSINTSTQHNENPNSKTVLVENNPKGIGLHKETQTPDSSLDTIKRRKLCDSTRDSDNSRDAETQTLVSPLDTIKKTKLCDSSRDSQKEPILLTVEVKAEPLDENIFT